MVSKLRIWPFEDWALSLILNLLVAAPLLLIVFRFDGPDWVVHPYAFLVGIVSAGMTVSYTHYLGLSLARGSIWSRVVLFCSYLFAAFLGMTLGYFLVGL